jgi:hypothetical protein
VVNASGVERAKPAIFNYSTFGNTIPSTSNQRYKRPLTFVSKTPDVRFAHNLTSLGPFLEMTSLKRKAEEQLTRSSVAVIEVMHY